MKPPATRSAAPDESKDRSDGTERADAPSEGGSGSPDVAASPVAEASRVRPTPTPRKPWETAKASTAPRIRPLPKPLVAPPPGLGGTKAPGSQMWKPAAARSGEDDTTQSEVPDPPSSTSSSSSEESREGASVEARPKETTATGATDEDRADDAAADHRQPFRPPALPRPDMLKAGASPKKRQDFREGKTPERTPSAGLSSIPRGIRPPAQSDGAPTRVPAGQTASFINAVAVELIAAAERESAEAETAAETETETETETPTETRAADASVASIEPERTVEPVGRRDRASKAAPSRAPLRPPSAAVIVLGAATLVAALVLAFGLPSEESSDGPLPEQASASEHRLAANASARDVQPSAAVERPHAPEPPEPPAPVDAATEGDTGAMAALYEDTDGMHGVGETESEGVESESPQDDSSRIAEAEVPSSTRHKSTRSRRRRSKSKSSSRDREPPPSDAPKQAAAAPEPKKEPSAKELLLQAKKALSSGSASKAYRLAAQANRKRRSASALRLMARAACRMGSKAKAKSAFDRLSISDRSGVRGECRRHGVRLGL